MFTGLEEVDWASMTHAYGDAGDVPDLLRRLASADPAEREIALDGMYGAVHHQGDVYDSTVACIPFLFALVTSDRVADRGAIVELLRGIGGDGRDAAGPPECPEDEEEARWAAWLVNAGNAVRAGAEVFLGLLDDPDPRLRAAVPSALAGLHGDPERVLTLLWRRTAVERDTGATRALVAAIGEIGLRVPG